jgi:hypothetical protein
VEGGVVSRTLPTSEELLAAVDGEIEQLRQAFDLLADASPDLVRALLAEEVAALKPLEARVAKLRYLIGLLDERASLAAAKASEGSS